MGAVANQVKEELDLPLPQIVRARERDLQHIVGIYKELYEDYPYLEMLSLPALRKWIKDPARILFVFKLEGEVIGAFKAHYHARQKIGYWGGMILRHEYHGKVSITDLAEKMVEISKETYPEADIWYGETRTAHPKTQYIFEKLGYDPYALFPIKDVFLGVRESDMLLASSMNPDLITKRRPRPRLLPEILNFFKLSNWRELLDKPEIVDLEFEPAPRISRVPVKIAQKPFQCGCISCSLVSDEFVKLHVTWTVKNAENMVYSYRSYAHLDHMLRAVTEECDKQGLFYVEAQISAYNPREQAVFAANGFVPTGYIPAFRYVGPGTRDRPWEREDIVVMARFSHIEDLPRMQLTPRARQILYQVIEIKAKLQERSKWMKYRDDDPEAWTGHWADKIKN